MRGLFLLFFAFYLFAIEAEVDCLILEDENSIICKYKQTRVNYEQKVIFEWIEPDGKISRTKNLTLPARYGSVYDYRYIKGRTKGKWDVRVKVFKEDEFQREVKTSFVLK